MTSPRHQRNCKPVVTALLVMGAGTGYAAAADVYDPATAMLHIPSATVGDATYSDVVVEVARILDGPSGDAPYADRDIYDPSIGEFRVGTVKVGVSTYHNVGIAAARLVSVGSVTGAAVYDGNTLAIPSVSVSGDRRYTHVVVVPGKVLAVAGGLPARGGDVYDPSSHRLTMPGLAANGRVYTNVTVTVDHVISIGGAAISPATPGSTTETFDFSYLFADGQKVTGDFTGTTTNGGLSVTDISNIQVELNGVAFAPVTVDGVSLGNATLQADAWNPATDSFSDTAPVTLYANGALNNFIFSDVDAAKNASPDYLFGYVNDGTNGIHEVLADNFLQTDSFSTSEGNSYQQALDTPGTAADWTLTVAPASGGPTDAPLPPWALGALGVGLVGIASRRLALSRPGNRSTTARSPHR